MFDTFTQKFPRDYTAAYTKRYTISLGNFNLIYSLDHCDLIWNIPLVCKRFSKILTSMNMYRYVSSNVLGQNFFIS